MRPPYCCILKYTAEVAQVFSKVLFSFLLSFSKMCMVAGSVSTKCCFVKTQNVFRSLVAWREQGVHANVNMKICV